MGWGWIQSEDYCQWWQLGSSFSKLPFIRKRVHTRHDSLKYTNQLKYKMLSGWALNLNDEEERCAQGTCSDSERKKDYCRSLNQNGSLEKVIKGNKKKTLFHHDDQKGLLIAYLTLKCSHRTILNIIDVAGKLKIKKKCVGTIQSYLCSSLKKVLKMSLYPWVFTQQVLSSIFFLSSILGLRGRKLPNVKMCAGNRRSYWNLGKERELNSEAIRFLAVWGLGLKY